MKKRNRKRASAGFTLLEVLVAVLVFGLMISAFGTGIANIIQTNGIAERRLQAELEITNIVERLQAEGIEAGKDYSTENIKVLMTPVDFDDDHNPVGYSVMVKPSETDAWTENITITTYIRAKE